MAVFYRAGERLLEISGSWRLLETGGAAANYYRWGNGLCICSRGEGNSEAAARCPAIDEVLKNEICLYLYFCATIHL